MSTLGRLRLGSTWRVRIQEGKALFWSSFFGKRFVVDLPSPSSSDFLSELFDGKGAFIREVDAEFQVPAVSGLRDLLFKKGILVERRNTDDKGPGEERWDRQVRFFNSFERTGESGADFQERLRQAHVVVIGAGGFGSWLAHHLGIVGIGTLTVVDFDTIELSNIGRCPFYRVEDIGRPKVDVLREYFAAHFPDTAVNAVNAAITSEKEFSGVLKDADFLFVPFGYHPEEHAGSSVIGVAVRAAIAAGVAHLCVGANAIGPLWTDRSTPCLFCSYSYPSLASRFREDPQPHPSIAKRQFAPLIAQTCARAVTEMTYHVTRVTPPSSKRTVLSFDYLKPERSTARPIERNHACVACGGS